MKINRARIGFYFLILLGIVLAVSNIDYARGDVQTPNVASFDPSIIVAPASSSSTDLENTRSASSERLSIDTPHDFETANQHTPQINGDPIISVVPLLPFDEVNGVYEVQSGDRFDVEVRSTDVVDIAGAQFKLEFDETLLIDLGDPDADDGTPLDPQVGSDFEEDPSANMDKCVNAFNNLGEGILPLALACSEGRTGVEAATELLLWTVKFQAQIVTDTQGPQTSTLGIMDESLLLANGQDTPLAIEGVIIGPDVSIQINPVNDVTLKLETTTSTVSFNQEFNMDIFVETAEGQADQPVSRVEAFIDYDVTFLDVVDCVGCVNEIIPRAGLDNVEVNSVDKAQGLIDYVASWQEPETDTDPTAFPKGRFRLATIRFRVLEQAGDTTVVVQNVPDDRVSKAQLVVSAASLDLQTTLVDANLTVVPIQRGDCNGDGEVAISDFRALILEFFDDDDNSNPDDAPTQGFLGNAVGCDANNDGQIAISDGRCIIIIFFEFFGGVCGGQGVLNFESSPAMLGAGNIPSIPFVGYSNYRPRDHIDSTKVNSGGSATSLQTPVSLSLTPSVLQVHQGEEFTLDVLAETGTQSVSGIQSYINFDPSQLEVRNISPGTALPSVLVNRADNEQGLMEFAAGKLGDPLPNGTFVLARVAFRALQGIPNLGISLSGESPKRSMADDFGTPLITNLSEGNIGVIPGIRGDCNGDGDISIADFRAVILEIFDDDGSDPAHTLGSSFAGRPVGCDSNSDQTISIADGRCVILATFDLPCGSPPQGRVLTPHSDKNFEIATNFIVPEALEEDFVSLG